MAVSEQHVAAPIMMEVLRKRVQQWLNSSNGRAVAFESGCPGYKSHLKPSEGQEEHQEHA